jgi:hypothetical protein
MIISEIELYELLKEKLGEEEAKALVEFLKQKAQSEVRIVTEEILEKIEKALSEFKNLQNQNIEELKSLIVEQIKESENRLQQVLNSKLQTLDNRLTKINNLEEKLNSIEGKLSDLNTKIKNIEGKTSGVKGLMFFLWLITMGAIIFNILLNIPATKTVILSLLGK